MRIRRDWLLKSKIIYTSHTFCKKNTHFHKHIHNYHFLYFSVENRIEICYTDSFSSYWSKRQEMRAWNRKIKATTQWTTVQMILSLRHFSDSKSFGNEKKGQRKKLRDAKANRIILSLFDCMLSIKEKKKRCHHKPIKIFPTVDRMYFEHFYGWNASEGTKLIEFCKCVVFKRFSYSSGFVISDENGMQLENDIMNSIFSSLPPKYCLHVVRDTFETQRFKTINWIEWKMSRTQNAILHLLRIVSFCAIYDYFIRQLFFLILVKLLAFVISFVMCFFFSSHPIMFNSIAFVICSLVHCTQKWKILCKEAMIRKLTKQQECVKKKEASGYFQLPCGKSAMQQCHPNAQTMDKLMKCFLYLCLPQCAKPCKRQPKKCLCHHHFEKVNVAIYTHTHNAHQINFIICEERMGKREFNKSKRQTPLASPLSARLLLC